MKTEKWKEENGRLKKSKQLNRRTISNISSNNGDYLRAAVNEVWEFLARESVNSSPISV